MLRKVILGTLIRRAAGYLGVAGMAGLESDVMQIGGAAAAVLSLVWSLAGKIKANRELRRA